jgi:hypothetical protein
METRTKNTEWIDNIFNWDYNKYGRTRVKCKIIEFEIKEDRSKLFSPQL